MDTLNRHLAGLLAAPALLAAIERSQFLGDGHSTVDGTIECDAGPASGRLASDDTTNVVGR